MGAIAAADYLGRNQHEISTADINGRIDELRTHQDGIDFDRNEEFTDEDLEELAALVDFRDQVEARTGNHFDEATIVPESQLTEYARDWANSLSNNVEFQDYAVLAFGNDTVYVR